MRVYIKQGSTASTAYQLDPGVVITLGGVSVGVTGNTVAIAADANLLIEGATAGKYVRTINGVQPDRDGDFLIEGSGCVSWSYTDEDIVDIALSGETIHGALLLTDMCPSCTTCENIYRLQHELEVMKVNINTLKDVSLYNESDAVTRRDGLSASRVTGTTSACGDYPNEDILTTRAAWLFREYVTMLHMWNYVVSINNASTVIQLAPETTAGFVVQTKHAVTSCNNETTDANRTTVDCKITVERMAGATGSEPADYSRMSVFIPEESCKFMFGPFNEPAEGGFEPITGSTVTVVTASPVTKKILTSFPAALISQKAGTYMMEAKFLPFIPSVTTVNGTTVTEENWRTISGGEESAAVSGGTTYDYKMVTSPQAPIPYPTRRDYLNSNIAPAAVVDLNLLWKVGIEWKIGDDRKTQTFLYKCNAIGVPCGNYITTESTINTDPEPEPNT